MNLVLWSLRDIQGEKDVQTRLCEKVENVTHKIFPRKLCLKMTSPSFSHAFDLPLAPSLSEVNEINIVDF